MTSLSEQSEKQTEYLDGAFPMDINLPIVLLSRKNLFTFVTILPFLIEDDGQESLTETTIMSSLKERFVETLAATRRKGMDQVLARLEEQGYFEAPASAGFHLNRKGGLMEHSMNVYIAALMLREQAVKVRPELEAQLPFDSIAISTLLHDTCKTDIYKETVLSRKKADGTWEKYPGYQSDYTTSLPLGHGEQSVIMLLSWGLELKPEEMLAIRWHMAAWDLPLQSGEHKESLNAAKAMTPLVSLVQLADGFAAGIMER